MKKILYISVILLLVAIISVNNVYSSTDKEEKIPETKKVIEVTKKSFTNSIKLVGDIEAKKQIYLAPIYSAKLENLAEDGQTVKKGDLIAKLESKEKEDRVAEIEMELGIAENDLNLLQKNTEAEYIKLNANIELAKKDVELKEIELKKLKDLPTKEELKKLKLNIDLTKKTLDISKNELEQKEKLNKRGIIKTKDLLEQELDVTRKEKEYKIAVAKHNITKRGATEISIKLAGLELKKAKNKLDTEENTLKFKKLETQEEISKIKVKVDMLKARVDQFNREIQESNILAPVSGTVVISRIWGSQGLEQVKVGDTIRRGRPFMSIADLNDVIIKTQLEEQYISMVKNGLSANITVNNDTRVFKGSISKIGILATEKKGRGFIEGQSKVFDLDIELKEKNSILKPGMSVDIEIILKKLENQIIIPNKAIFKEDSKNYVLMANGEKKYIKLGDTNEKESVIIEGLNVNEKILIEKENQLGV